MVRKEWRLGRKGSELAANIIIKISSINIAIACFSLNCTTLICFHCFHHLMVLCCLPLSVKRRLKADSLYRWCAVVHHITLIDIPLFCAERLMVPVACFFVFKVKEYIRSPGKHVGVCRGPAGVCLVAKWRFRLIFKMQLFPYYNCAQKRWFPTLKRCRDPAHCFVWAASMT